MYGEGYTQEEERGHGGWDFVKGRLGDGALIGTGQNKKPKNKKYWKPGGGGACL